MYLQIYKAKYNYKFIFSHKQNNINYDTERFITNAF